jgi:hypothetical protein
VAQGKGAELVGTVNGGFRIFQKKSEFGVASNRAICILGAPTGDVRAVIGFR